MFRLITTFFLLNLCLTINAQTDVIHAQLDKYNNHFSELSSEEKIELLNQISFSYRSRKLDSATFYNNKAMEIALELGNKKLISNSWYHKANIQIAKANYDLALLCLKKCDSIARVVDDVKQQGLAIHQKAMVYYNKGVLDSTIALTKVALKKLIPLNEVELMGDVYGDMANAYAEKLDLDSALKYYGISRKYFEQVGFEKGIARNLLNEAVTLMDLGKYDKAVEQFVEAANFFSTLGDEMGVAIAATNLGDVYIQYKNYDKALQYYQESLTASELVGNPFLIANAKEKIANILVYKKRYKDALPKYQDVKEDYLKLGQSRSVLHTYFNIGNVFMELQQYDSAVYYFKLLEEFDGKGGEYAEVVALGYLALGRVYGAKDEKDYKKGISSLKKGLKIAREIGFITGLGEGTKQISDYYYQFGDSRNAYINLLEAYNLKDSLIKSENSAHLAEMTTLYETEKKQREIELLEKEKAIQEATISKERLAKTLWAGGVGFLLLFSGFGYINYRNSQKRKFHEMLTEQQVLRTSSIIQSEEKERKRIAGDLHDSVGQMLASAKLYTQSLAKTNDKEDIEIAQSKVQSLLDSALVEVRQISHNLKPRVLEEKGLEEAVAELVRQINLSKQIKIEYSAKNLKTRLNEVLEVSCYRLVQEVVHNMIKHAEATEIKIAFRQNPNQIFLELSDNGKGFDVNQIKRSTGIGWDNIYSRVSMLNGDIKINSEKDFGTTIQFMFSLS